MNNFIELLRFLRFRKKLWLAPVVFLMAFIGAFLIFAESSVLSPFIYPFL